MKILLTFFMSLGLTALALADSSLQAQDMPSDIKSAVSSKYASAEVVHYMKVDDAHSVMLRKGNSVMVARFDNSNKWINTYTELSSASMPQVTKDYLTDRFPGRHFKDIRKVEDETGISYIILLNADQNPKALIFDKEGNFTKEEDIKEDTELLEAFK